MIPSSFSDTNRPRRFCSIIHYRDVYLSVDSPELFFSVTIFVSVTELTLTPTLILTLTLTITITLNRPKNNSGELTDKYTQRCVDRQSLSPHQSANFDQRSATESAAAVVPHGYVLCCGSTFRCQFPRPQCILPQLIKDIPLN